ncbi:MAG: Ldh family oxidoreductase [Thermomicrobiales bacterium]|nr:Ldh family oxidoreductase [Thermomicrobiales bacterium]
MPTVIHSTLRAFSRTIFEAVGTPPNIALVVANSLVDANLAGHDSHGVLRLPGYCGSLRDGDIVPDARAALIRRDRATAIVDGALGWGQPAMQLATDTTVELAREHGLGATVVRRCYHVGRVAPYVETVARAGMIGLAMSNAGPGVAPFGGRQRVLGTNPFAWSMPIGGRSDPLTFDIATAAIAEGKLRVARANGRPVDPTMLVDRDGKPTSDPNDFFAGGAILPFGGHKGNGISILAQMLGRSLAGMDTTGFDGPRGANGPIVLAIDPTCFTTAEEFATEVAAQAMQICSSRPADGVEEVLLPGEIERRTVHHRLDHGIPIPDTTWSELDELARSLGVEMIEGGIEVEA